MPVWATGLPIDCGLTGLLHQHPPEHLLSGAHYLPPPALPFRRGPPACILAGMKQILRWPVLWGRRVFRDVWRSRGGGFYGFVAALTFLYLEVVDIGGDLVGLPRASLDLAWLIGFLVQNLVDVLMNTIRAALWPLVWIDRFGVSLMSGALLAGAYTGYLAVRPVVLRLIDDPDGPPVPAHPEPPSA